MAIWVLEPMAPIFDERRKSEQVTRVVIRAKEEEDARVLAAADWIFSREARDRDAAAHVSPSIWLDPDSTMCRRLDPDGPDGVIARDHVT